MSEPLVTIVDYGMGNLGSIANMLRHLQIESCVSARAEDLARATHLILPGVGAFDSGMQQIKARGLLQPLENEVLLQKKPLLGICLGMQLLLESSDEGIEAGLGWVKGRSKRFAAEKNLKVPHMGWNVVHPSGSENNLFEGFATEPRFYFVHSYKVECDELDQIAGRTSYGTPFVSALRKENIEGVQFHPEKSHQFGLKLFRNFVRKREN